MIYIKGFCYDKKKTRGKIRSGSPKVSGFDVDGSPAVRQILTIVKWPMMILAAS